jgi:hypothetical protein
LVGAGFFIRRYIREQAKTRRAFAGALIAAGLLGAIALPLLPGATSGPARGGRSAQGRSPQPDCELRKRQLPLARLEFALLDRLASDPQRVFTKEELLREVWGLRSMETPAPSTPTPAGCDRIVGTRADRASSFANEGSATG